MSFDHCNCLLKIWKSIGTPTSQSGGSFGSVAVHSLTLSCTFWEHEMWFLGSLLAHTFASPCFGREPKARVATYSFWKDFLERNNNCVAKWNFKAREEREREVRSLKIVKHHNTLWGGSLGGKQFVHKYARWRHAL